MLLIGDLILDRYLTGDAERISPEAPVPVLRVTENRHAAGGAANVAVCATALGCQVFCGGIIGEDAPGRLLRDLLEEQRIDADGLLASRGRPTTVKTRLVGLAQHRHRQQLLRIDEEVRDPISPEETRSILQWVEATLPKVQCVCLEDYDKGLITQELVSRVIGLAGKRGVPVLVDPAKRENYERYAGATLITPNRQELGEVTQRGSLDSIEAAADAATSFLTGFNCNGLVVTLDRDGCLLAESGREPMHIPTRPRQVYDNTGAGDAVLATLACAIAAGADRVSAVRLANVAGGLEVEKFGCVAISAEEILADLRLTARAGRGKLRTLAELLPEVQLRRDRGETLVFTNGCFDLLHAGHVALLEKARQTASFLVLGLNSDASVRRQGKGPVDRPLVPFEDRARVLTGLESVEYIVGFDAPTPIELIRALRPDVLIKGEDWSGSGVVGSDIVEAYGGRVILIPLLEGRSTTDLVKRIRGAGA